MSTTGEVAESHEPVNPFEGLELYSPSEALAAAQINSELQGLGEDADELLRRRLQYERDAITVYLVEYAPDFVPEEYMQVQQQTRAERDFFRSQGFHSAELDPFLIIRKHAAQARWQISGLDPDNLPNPRQLRNPVRIIEDLWNDGESKQRVARIAAIKAEITALQIEEQIADFTGQPIDQQIRARVDALSQEGKRLTPRHMRDAYFSS